MSEKRLQLSALLPLALSVLSFALLFDLVLSGQNINTSADEYFLTVSRLVSASSSI